MTINRVAIIGTGVVGASGAALFLAKGLDVVATDIAPDAQQKLESFIKAAWPSLQKMGFAPGASLKKLRFTSNLDEAIAGVDLVQENGPERIDFKQGLYKHLDKILRSDAI